ncbi:LysR substrate-binding domain-containing protein [Pseudoruegeria sp. HB172150]|uniref:LysR substrate-binding domain-containing protein n=1 Tax=Pseudoruegeria sp. HB172150 TaxID=2721164 RepID=UPI001554A4E9|nr:LysR substrate-binding domain-containing protein [Pseudoruegeria sp. HB172150]
MITDYPSLPPLQCLRAFLAVADLQHFTRVADRLGLTQTAVSHQVAQLEEQLGCKLFVRSRPSVALTPEGQRLLPAVHDGLRLIREGIEAAMPARPGSDVFLSCSPELSAQWLAPRLERFYAEHPNARVCVKVEYHRANLSAGEADIAIWPGPGGPEHDAIPLGLEEEFAICSPDLYATLPPTKALKAAPLLSYAGARHTVLDWARWYAQAIALKPPGAPGFDSLEFGPEYPTFEAMLEAARRGAGFALVRTSLVDGELRRGELVRCFTGSVASDMRYHIVTAKNATARPEIGELRDWLLLAATEEA